jgi:cytochrome c556
MSLRLRRLKLMADTREGPYGVDLPFTDGLVVLRADNTSGKSTCIQAIFYALGLEAMLTTRHTVPLPHAMTDYLETPSGPLIVTDSFVMLEIENARGEVMTVQRWAKSETYEPNLIQVWDGPALSEPAGGFAQQDMYVRLPGSAMEGGAGFYPRLERFLGWELPLVVRADGRAQKLYMEMVFPLFFVEQKRGWGGIQVQMPPYQGVPDPRKRAIEFTLALEVYQRAERRRELEAEVATVTAEWEGVVGQFERSLRGRGVSLQGIPDRPPGSWPPEVRPTLQVLEGDAWTSIDTVMRTLLERLAVMEESEIPKAEEAAAQTAQALRQNEDAVQTLAAAIGVTDDEVRAETDQIESLDRRLESLEQDLRQNRDALTLRRLGSEADLRVLDGECPTCHQQVPSSLLEGQDVQAPMSVEENITFIQEQQRTFEAMRRQGARSLEGKRERLAAMHNRLTDLRSEIRAQRAALLSPSQVPSIAALEERLRLRDRGEELQRLREELSETLASLDDTAERHRDLRQKLADMPDVGLSDLDRLKLERLQTRLLEQLREYGFRSFQPDEIEISEVRYTPSREGYDLGFDLSASDGIRTIWAYLLALMEVAREKPTNHPGLLVFDEPRQQEADPLSVQALIGRASQAGPAGQQVVFATSEPEESLRGMLDGLNATLLTFDGKILAPLDRESASP